MPAIANSVHGAVQTMRRALGSVRIMFAVAPLATTLKLFQQAVTAAMAPAALYFTQSLVDAITAYLRHSAPVSRVYLWAGLLVIAALLSDNINFIGALQVISMQRRLNQKLTDVLITKFRKLDYACFEDSSIQDTLERMGPMSQMRIFRLFQGTTDILAALISAIGLSLVVAQVSVWFSVALFVVLLGMMALLFRSVDMQVALYFKQTREDRQMKYFAELLSDKRSLFELRLFGSLEWVRKKWDDKARSVLRARVRNAVRAQGLSAASSLAVIAWIAAVTAVLLAGLSAGRVTLGLFVSLIGSVKSVSGIKQDLERAFRNTAGFHLEMEHYDRFMALPEVLEGADASAERPRGSGLRLVFDDVVFTYPGTKRPVLDHVSFEIDFPEHVALVGKNGSGKSTIVKLLGRLYAPDSGTISINGVPLQMYTREQLCEMLGFIFQDHAHYALTLRENVAAGDISKLEDDEALLRALEMSLFDEPRIALDTNLGKLESGGIDLSGGQWQRVALARALVSESDLVVLDEPTASLDPVAESEMYRSFSEVMDGRACLMISHRLASAKMCDKIIVLDGGTVVETGSHEHLMRKGGLYHRMFTLQSSWYSGNVALPALEAM
ncbi:MAG: ABC transporter ATP-binding protein [Coriobacteriia bacterium]